MEHELITHLARPEIAYLDYYTGDFDHIAHLTNDASSQRNEIRSIDALIGRIWTAIQTSPLGPETVLFVVSDHGMNSDERIYSQGYNLIDLFGSAAGGGHHVVTNRYAMQNYKLRGLDPFVSNVVSPSVHSYYLRDQSSQYPTVLLDLDGNERANVYLRNNDLNVLQLLLQQIAGRETTPSVRAAAMREVLAVIDRHRQAWQSELDGLNQELTAIRETIKTKEAALAAAPRSLSKAQKAAHEGQQRRRVAFQLDTWKKEQRGYLDYVRIVSNLLAQTAESLADGRFRMEDLIPSRAMGDRNTLGQLQNYVIALSPAGLQLQPDGSLDMETSFRRLNYFSVLRSVGVRNNVQPGVGSQPIDFVAVRIPAAIAAKSFPSEPQPLGDAVWVYQSDAQQLAILSHFSGGIRQYRCLPIASLTQEPNG
ncbi:MAG: alkaline phosphatase family protein, partial [Bryobacteraceae bacterium]